jgi:hypothetical protein
MDYEQILGLFEDLAKKLSIEVRHDPTYRGSGALCTIHGKKVLILNAGLSPAEKVAVFVQEFKGLKCDDVFLVPVLREMLGEGESQER